MDKTASDTETRRTAARRRQDGAGRWLLVREGGVLPGRQTLGPARDMIRLYSCMHISEGERAGVTEGTGTMVCVFTLPQSPINTIGGVGPCWLKDLR